MARPFSPAVKAMHDMLGSCTWGWLLPGSSPFVPRTLSDIRFRSALRLREREEPDCSYTVKVQLQPVSILIRQGAGCPGR